MAIIVPLIFMLGVLLGKSSWRTLIYNISGVESKMSLFICMCFWWRWWAWTIIKNLSPEEMLQVRAKVATLECLKGQRADLGLQRAWEGNYLVSVIFMKEFNKKEQQLNWIANEFCFPSSTLCADAQKRDSPEAASSFTLVSSDLQRKDKFMRVLFSCNVRKVQHTFTSCACICTCLFYVLISF